VRAEFRNNPVETHRYLQEPGISAEGKKADKIEYWHLSQSGLKIKRGSRSSDERSEAKVVWVEDPSQFDSEAAIFDFLHVPYLKPDERCA
jgi:hypothetical protein